MRSITRWVGIVYAACTLAILFALLPGQVSSNRSVPEATSRSAFLPVAERVSMVDDIEVYAAVVDNSHEIFIADQRTGQARQLTTHTATDRFPVLSPTGDRIAFVSWRDGNSEIYVIDLLTGTLRNLSHHADRDGLPVWSPDGTLLAYVSRYEGNSDIVIADVLRGLTHNLTQSPANESQPEWSPDGQGVIFSSIRDGRPARYLLNLGESTPLLYSPTNQWQMAQNEDSIGVSESEIPG